MKRMFVGIILIVSLFGCGRQESKTLKYEKAKREAEWKFTELEEILKPIKALERGDTSALFSADPETLKRLSKNSNIQTIQKLSNEVTQAMERVSELKPEGYNDDYEQWTQKIKERWVSIK